MKVKLNSRQLRWLIKDSMPVEFSTLDDEPFTESSHDDGCFHGSIDSKHDTFGVSVDLRGFLRARFDARNIELEWSDYEWRYRATFDADLSPAELQLLEQIDDE